MRRHVAGGSAYQIFRLAHASAAPGAAHAAAVSFDEFKHVCAEFNMGLKGGELRALFDDLDHTKSGRLELEDIVASFAAKPKASNFADEHGDADEAHHREMLEKFQKAKVPHSWCCFGAALGLSGV